jgi:hypothetical protein
MRDHGYDLRYYLELNWSKIGPRLVGKIHVICGDMGNFYLNLAVYRLENFLTQSNPYYDGHFDYGWPMKGRGWQPNSNIDLIRAMAKHIANNAPNS